MIPRCQRVHVNLLHEFAIGKKFYYVNWLHGGAFTYGATGEREKWMHACATLTSRLRLRQ
jgi:hypothetical protein